jgi:hypothetical protein
MDRAKPRYSEATYADVGRLMRPQKKHSLSQISAQLDNDVIAH